MRLLVTNDDGIDARGLLVLTSHVAELGDVVVVAPDGEYSGSGASLGAIHGDRPAVHRAKVEGAVEAWSVAGPPALCVLFARLGAFGPTPDIVVSGINPGSNVGRAIYHSGTVGAALTARLGGITGVAVSQAVTGFAVEGQAAEDALDGQLWDTAGRVAALAVGAALSAPPAEAIALNLNVPNRPFDELEGWQSTRPGGPPPRSVAGARLVERPGHEDSFWVDATWSDAQELPEGTDGGAVLRGYVSSTVLGTLGRAADEPPAVAAALNRIQT
jgi:5'-nucleotidase